MPMDLLVPLAAEVVSGWSQKLVCQRDTVLERLGSQVDDLAVFVFDGRGTGPFVWDIVSIVDSKGSLSKPTNTVDNCLPSWFPVSHCSQHRGAAQTY
jgi:hypothetical protein